MALRNARDLYTRRQEGVSIWVVPAARDHRVQPGREGRLLRPGRRQDLPAPHLLRGARRGGSTCERPTVEYALRLGDDALIAAQRLAEWSARAPEMEEDVALANIALDQLGVARLLLLRGELRAPADEDELAYLRDDHEFRNCLLVELPNGPARGDLDFGWTMAKLLFLVGVPAAALRPAGRLRRRAAGRRSAAKARKESAYHLDHASQWTVRLGDGTDESHRRMQAAVDELWPYTHELFDATPAAPVDAAAPARPTGRARSRRAGRGDADPAGRRLDARPAAATGGTPSTCRYLLAEMQVLHRAHPGATW